MTYSAARTTTDAARAAINASMRGVGFFKLRSIAPKVRKAVCCSEIKFVTNPFDGSDQFFAKLLPQFAHMNVDRPVTYDHVITPHTFQDLFARKHLPRLGSQ